LIKIKSYLKRASAAQQIHRSTEDLNDLIIDSITDIKGKQIIKLDLRALDDAPTDFFIICEGDSNTQVRSIGQNIQTRLKAEIGVFPGRGAEGLQTGKWVCLDYFTTVVHIFHRETREFYALEDLWSDANFTEYANL
jgi:ribosome-associated protein